MEELYNELVNYLSSHADELDLTLIDEDWGQLEALLNGEDGSPVTFPCLLISFGETQWTQVKGPCGQRGILTLTTRLAFDCYDDTYAGAMQQGYGQHRRHTALLLHRLLQGQRPDVMNCGPILRASSRTVRMPKGIMVYETDYRITVEE